MNEKSGDLAQASGFILIDKQTGITSHDVVKRLRSLTKIRKIGHAGTLDPFASGLLIVAIGRGATKEISQFVKMDKSYEADLFLGATSSTHDPEGEITVSENQNIPSKDEVLKVLEKFIGRQMQIPPMHSAKKINGKKLYELARQGKEVERKPADINIYALDLVDYEWPCLKIRTAVSSGTYIRVLASDIGYALGVGAYLSALRRLSIGEYSVDDSIRLEKVDDANWKDLLF